MLFCWNLRDDYGYEDQTTAGQFVNGHSFVQQQPSAQNREYRFQTHDQRSGSGLHILLANDLQGEGNAQGQNTRVGDGDPAGQDVCDDNIFRQTHDRTGEDAAEQALNAVESESIQIRSQLIHQSDLYRIAESAAQQIQVTDVDLGDTNTTQ